MDYELECELIAEGIIDNVSIDDITRLQEETKMKYENAKKMATELNGILANLTSITMQIASESTMETAAALSKNHKTLVDKIGSAMGAVLAKYAPKRDAEQSKGRKR